jgi:hypothetical protein
MPLAGTEKPEDNWHTGCTFANPAKEGRAKTARPAARTPCPLGDGPRARPVDARNTRPPVAHPLSAGRISLSRSAAAPAPAGGPSPSPKRSAGVGALFDARPRAPPVGIPTGGGGAAGVSGPRCPQPPGPPQAPPEPGAGPGPGPGSRTRTGIRIPRRGPVLPRGRLLDPVLSLQEGVWGRGGVGSPAPGRTGVCRNVRSDSCGPSRFTRLRAPDPPGSPAPGPIPRLSGWSTTHGFKREKPIFPGVRTAPEGAMARGLQTPWARPDGSPPNRSHRAPRSPPLGGGAPITRLTRRPQLAPAPAAYFVRERPTVRAAGPVPLLPPPPSARFGL